MIEQQNTMIVVASQMTVPGLPGRPMADLGGVPLVFQTWRQAGAAKLGHVIVAASDWAMAEAVKAAGGDAIVTPRLQPSPAHRAAAALALRDPEARYSHILILTDIMPFPEESLLQRCLAGLTNEQVDVATVAAPTQPSAASAGWRVQAPLGADREVAYARRFLPEGEAVGEGWSHVPVWAFRRSRLEAFASTAPESTIDIGPRALSLSWPVAVVRVDRMPLLVEEPAGLERARAYLRQVSV